MRVHRYDVSVPLDALVRDARAVAGDWDWSRGAFGHALSLPAPRDLHPYSRYSYQNSPCTSLLDRAPALRSVFDSFACEKVSFRLLRRPPRSSYAWHTDEWKGPGVVRFQVPLVSESSAFLVTTEYRRVDEIKGDPCVLSAESFDKFSRANNGRVSRHYLEPGVLHYFNTTYVHTLVNAGENERITLSFDLVANDWLKARFPDIQAEIGLSPAALPRPGAVRLALEWSRARLHPLRTRMRTMSHRRPEV